MIEPIHAWLLNTGHRLGIVTSYKSLHDGSTRLAWQDGTGPSRWRMATIIAGICTFALFPLAYVVLFVHGKPGKHGLPTAAPYTTIRWGPHWSGWQGIDHMVVLGDSWSSTGFDLSGAQPSADNPLGNPSFPGATVTNGENWVDYLVLGRNKSIILAADLAVGGATVDTDLIKPGVPASSLRSLKVQVEEFREQYVESASFPWNANHTLFTLWVGVNDITAYNNETKKNFPKEFDEVAGLLDTLFDLGARNFLLFNAPPLDKSPLAPFSDLLGEWPEMVDEWNRNFSQIVGNFTAEHTETTIFSLDAHALFDDIIDEPCLYPETCDLIVMTDCCDKYMFGTLTPDYKDPECDYSVDKYFWINRLHPSTQTHNMISHVIYDAVTVADDTYD